MIRYKKIVAARFDVDEVVMSDEIYQEGKGVTPYRICFLSETSCFPWNYWIKKITVDIDIETQRTRENIALKDRITELEKRLNNITNQST